MTKTSCGPWYKQKLPETPDQGECPNQNIHSPQYLVPKDNYHLWDTKTIATEYYYEAAQRKKIEPMPVFLCTQFSMVTDMVKTAIASSIANKEVKYLRKIMEHKV